MPTYEYTVGGPVFRDRLWFFHAGRYENEKLGRNLFAPVNTGYTRTTLRRRFEGKGTYSPFSGHTARVSYLNNFTRSQNSNFQNEMDLRQPDRSRGSRDHLVAQLHRHADVEAVPRGAVLAPRRQRSSAPAPSPPT